jgi:hypothetical protein
MLGCILLQFSMGDTFPRTTLIYQDYPVLLRMKVLAVDRLDTSAGATMNEQHRLSVRIAAFLIVDRVNVGDRQVHLVVGIDGGIQFTH